MHFTSVISKTYYVLVTLYSLVCYINCSLKAQLVLNNHQNHLIYLLYFCHVYILAWTKEDSVNKLSQGKVG